MKVVQKRKLLSKDKDGFYINNDTFKVMRNRAVIESHVVEESHQSYKDTGIIWVVDEKATQEWLDAKSGKKQTKAPKKDVLEFDGMQITEDNIDDFILDNGIVLGNTSTPSGKLKKVKKWIEDQSK